jgi:hypothetical protein
VIEPEKMRKIIEREVKNENEAEKGRKSERKERGRDRG